MTSTIETDIVQPQSGTNTNLQLKPKGTGAVTVSGQAMPTDGGLWTGRNLWINGEFTCSQRATSASSITSAGYHTVDRLYFNYGSMGTWTLSQSTDVPSGKGFGYSFKADCTTADASPASTDKLLVAQSIEGQNLQRLKKGTSEAEDITISFWVKSGKTGVHIVEIYDNDNTRSINKSYTISSADTWENHSITFAGDTTGTLTNDNGTSLTIGFWLGAGSNFTSGTLATSWASATNANRAVGQVNLADNTANNWLITGIMVEAGSSATPFEYESYTETLLKCQRYFTKIAPRVNSATIRGYNASGAVVANWMSFQTQMRTEPTCAITGTWAVSNCGQPTFHSFSVDGISFGATTSSAADTYFYPDDASEYITCSAEL